MNKQASQTPTKSDISLLPVGIRALVTEKDPMIQQFINHALYLRQLKAKRNAR